MSNIEKMIIGTALSSLVVKPKIKDCLLESSESCFSEVVFEPTKITSIVFGAVSNIFDHFDITQASASSVAFEIPWTDWKTRPILMKVDHLKVIVNARVNKGNFDSKCEGKNEKNLSYNSIDRALDSPIIKANKIHIKFILETDVFNITLIEFESSPCAHDFKWPSGVLWSLKESQMKSKGEVMMFRIIKWQMVEMAMSTKEFDDKENPIKFTVNKGFNNLTLIKSVIGKHLTQIKYAAFIEEANVFIDLNVLDETNYSEEMNLLQNLLSSLLNFECQEKILPKAKKQFKLNLRRSSVTKACELIINSLNQNGLSSKIKINCLNVHIVHSDLQVDKGKKSDKKGLRMRVEGLVLSTSIAAQKADRSPIESGTSEMNLGVQMDRIQIHLTDSKVNEEPFFIAPFIYECVDPFEGPVISAKLLIDLPDAKSTCLSVKIGPSRIGFDMKSTFYFVLLLDHLSEKLGYSKDLLSKWDIEMTMPLIALKNETESEVTTEIKAGKVSLSKQPSDEDVIVLIEPIWAQMINQGKCCTILEPVEVKIIVTFTGDVSISITTLTNLTAATRATSPMMTGSTLNFITKLHKQIRHQWSEFSRNKRYLNVHIEIASASLYLTQEYQFLPECKLEIEKASAKEVVDDDSLSGRRGSDFKGGRRKSRMDTELVVNEFNRSSGLMKEFDTESPGMSFKNKRRPSADEILMRKTCDSSICSEESDSGSESPGLIRIIDAICSRAKVDQKEQFLRIQLNKITIDLRCNGPNIECEVKSNDTIECQVNSKDTTQVKGKKGESNEIDDEEDAVVKFLVKAKFKVAQMPTIFFI